MTIRTSFPVGAERCAAWLTMPSGTGPHPVVLLVHGGGATHAMKLDQYERWFSAAGFAVLAFDFRHLGESDGMPRQLMSVKRYREDIEAALAFIRNHDALDGSRVALWGTSLGASHVVMIAARRRDIAAAVIQCPILRARAPALRSGIGHLARFTGPILSDLVRAALGLDRRYVPVVGRPGELAFVNRPGAYEGWYSVIPPGYAFDNRIPAGAGLTMLFYDVSTKARQVECPILVCVCDEEDLMDPAIAARFAAEAPRGVAKHYDADHFAVYHPPVVDRMIEDQIDFLRDCLLPDNRPGLASRTTASVDPLPA